MDDVKLLNFQSLMKKIINGDLSIQDPLNIHNKRLDTLSKVSFLNHLLNYKNIDKENILEVLFKIYLMFQDHIEKLKTNQTIQVMLERINNEWYNPDNLYTINIPLSYGFFDMSKYVKSKYLDSYDVCNKIDQLCKIETNISFNEDNLTHPLEPHLDSGISNCEDTIKEIKKIIETIEKLLDYLKTFDLYQFIDLSIKHKSLYLKLNEKEDDDIPTNIHVIFSNFIYIHNLFYKQTLHYYHHISSVLETIELKCNKMKEMSQNIQSIAYMRESQAKEYDESDDDDYYSRPEYEADLVFDSDDDEIILKNGLLVANNSNKKDDNLFSFF